MIRQYDYTKFAKYYDIVELRKIGAEKRNNFVKSILLRYGVKSVLDMTAGTGSQSILLARHFDVTANDINKAMLSIAKKNAKAQHLHIRFNIGDMRSVRLGKFDAVISIFNAIAHLSKAGFAKALKNINSNLKSGGIYIFDIFNAKYMDKNFRHFPFIDVSFESGGTKFVRFNKNTYDSKSMIMHIHQKTYVQPHDRPFKMLKENWSMQIYTLNELKTMLADSGFKIISTYGDLLGAKFNDATSPSIVIVAKKASSG